jgi:AcrR family transcriptional regulator
MGRKSKIDERREHILAAFERCIVSYGIDVSLERIAEEAGVKRSLIRHYLGNRDEVVGQLIARIADAYPSVAAAEFEKALVQGVEGFLELLFNPYLGTTEWGAVINSVANTAPERYPEAKRRLGVMLDTMVADLAVRLSVHFPAVTLATCREVAYGLLYLSQGYDVLQSFGMSAEYARASARRLLADLNPS